VTARRAPSAERNRVPILHVLQRILPSRGTVLEIASGTGQHAAYFAQAFDGLTWQPTDTDPEALASIAAWVSETGTPNLRPPVSLDVRAPWPVDAADVVLCINMIHISPWACSEALFAGAARALPAGGLLVTYGPYRIGGEHTAPSNAQFDAWLQAQDPAWGVRDLGELAAAAARHGIRLEEQVPMPANNFLLVWRKA
jgi:SAM-dependent methyltransferase